MTARRPISGNAARKIALVDSSAEPVVSPASAHLLETKLYAPRSGAGLVARPGLVARLREGAEHRLTLVSAPAGFGKTTLLSDWLADGAADERAVGWVSLDPSDNEPALFWAYVIGALQRALPGVGRNALALLHSQPLTAVVTALINEIAATDADVLLVLDDYHVIQSPAIHDALALLLDRLPARMHVVVASRSDPPLALPRLRARGELTELRVAELRFTPEQAAAFLNGVMGLHLSHSDTVKLERRTEGWIAALKLAALSLKGRSDVRGFVDAFSGDNRYVADYLVDEVLRSQPDRIRRFLLSTASLDRLSGPLCDAVTGEEASQALLEDLERANLFVIALDDRREWYRYHHLFADVLQTHALREDPDWVRGAHGRASAWHERYGSRAQAVRHAMAAEDMERAARLLEMAWPQKNRSYESGQWLECVRALPESVIRRRPVLSMGYAWALLNGGELEDAAARLRDVERWVERPGVEPEMIVSDPERLNSLPFELASAQVYLAQSRGDVSGTVEYARRALGLISEGDLPGRATGTALLALAYWANGELEPAHATFTDALALMRTLGAMLDVVRGTFVLGDIRMAQGRLREARTFYERGLELAATEIDPAAAPETDELYLGLSELHIEWGDLSAAEGFLGRITRGAERADHRGNKGGWCATMAAVRAASGDLNGALALLDEAEAVQIRGPVPRARSFGAMKARIWAKQGRTAEAMGWLQERGVSADDELAYLREYEHVTLARVLIARCEEGDVDDALDLLERLAAAAEAGGRTGNLIEIAILQALAHRARGDVRNALAPLGRALSLAEPEGFLRLFLDEGQAMRDLLRHATARGIAPDATRRILAAFDQETTAAAGAPKVPAGPASLTPKEVVILRLIGEGLRNQEIADHLFISPATVKRHIANTYAKLGVGHRTEALVRAKALNLL